MKPPTSVLYERDVEDGLKRIKKSSVHCCVTSPPYWNQRDYGTGDSQIGIEKNPQDYIDKLVRVFDLVRRVLRKDGTLWLNIGDKYMDKQLCGIPWRVALSLKDSGWLLRSDIIWSKPNTIPSSAPDRPSWTHEYIFMLTKSEDYFYDSVGIREPSPKPWSKKKDLRRMDRKGSSCREEAVAVNASRENSNLSTANKKSVWSIPIGSLKLGHFAVFPPELPETCILAGTSRAGCCGRCGAPRRRILDKTRIATRPGKNSKSNGVSDEVRGNRDPRRHITEVRTTGWEPTCGCIDCESIDPCVVLDPFCGSGTTGVVAAKHGCSFIGIDNNTEYIKFALDRINPHSRKIDLFRDQVSTKIIRE